MGFCPVCGNWVDEGDICGHCGNSGDYEDEYDDIESFKRDSLSIRGFSEDQIDYVLENEFKIDGAEYFYWQAETHSIKGDHSTAIKFYKEALRLKGPDEDCKILSLIADEYEAIGEYALSEEYWRRCCGIKNYYSYMYITQKGDFFYRRERYAEAIGAYEEALKTLKDMGDEKITLHMIEYYAIIAHYLISSYISLEGENPQEKYHSELKRVINGFVNAKWMDDKTKARYLSKTAWKIYENESMTDEALILIDSAIELHPDDDCYYRKATFIKHKLEISVIVGNLKPHDLEMINEALKILPDDCDHGPYLKVKGDILKKLGESVKAKVCYALAAKDYDKVDEADRLLKKLTPYSTYINITGVQYYKHFAPFKPGTIVDLIKEPDNKHDSFAIRVEINGETVGYVANSEYTLIKEVKSAAEIKNNKSTQAEVLFILFGEWVIAKLI